MDSGHAWSEQKYDRKIKYLDYLENGTRVCGIGFVKLELRDGRCCINLQINGLYRRDYFTRSLLLLADGEERELCKLQLAEGGVKVCIDGLDGRDLDGHGLRYEQVTGVRIQISEGKEIRCLWGAEKTPRKEEPARKEAPEQKETVPPEKPPVAENMIAGEQYEEQAPAKGDAYAADNAPEEESGDWSAPPVVHEDKWAQLWAIYPHIEPFHDGREYMSMGPGDFVILPGRHYKLVNNSFLLHGYYNYHHLIMTRVEQRSDTEYYIGVPGNYYEREKKIAVMFGFESFECGTEPAEEGDFGYYMIPVEL